MVLPAKDYWLMKTQEQTHFGDQTVPLAEKQGLVDEVFHSVARRYDLMNDLMSAGLHRAWKAALVTAVNPPHKSDRSFALLDLAGGTGDIAFRTIEAGGPNTRVTVCDINAEMLAVGRERAAEVAQRAGGGRFADLAHPRRLADLCAEHAGRRGVCMADRHHPA